MPREINQVKITVLKFHASLEKSTRVENQQYINSTDDHIFLTKGRKTINKIKHQTITKMFC